MDDLRWLEIEAERETFGYDKTFAEIRAEVQRHYEEIGVKPLTLEEINKYIKEALS